LIPYIDAFDVASSKKTGDGLENARAMAYKCIKAFTIYYTMLCYKTPTGEHNSVANITVTLRHAYIYGSALTWHFPTAYSNTSCTTLFPLSILLKAPWTIPIPLLSGLLGLWSSLLRLPLLFLLRNQRVEFVALAAGEVDGRNQLLRNGSGYENVFYGGAC
jgi:hypothetical protein